MERDVPPGGETALDTAYANIRDDLLGGSFEPAAKLRVEALCERYGLGPTCNSSDLEHGPLSKRLVPTFMPDSPRNRFINRLLFDFDVGPEY